MTGTTEAPAPVPPAVSPAVTPPGAQPPPPTPDERRRLRTVRRFGTTGSLLMAIGALGCGATPAPAYNPLLGTRVLGLWGRMPTVSLTLAYIGMGMLVLAWLWLGRLAWPGRVRLSVRQLTRILVMWMAPLAVAPPLFSTDVYGYLSQAEVVSRGFDPYIYGAAQALGLSDPLVASIPTIWRTTPSPYGPGFLSFGRLITGIAGDDIVLGVYLHRVLALASLGLVIWAVPHLARRAGVEPIAALWLAISPLVLFHLVSGIHNDAIMLGVVLAGMEIGMRRSWVLGALLIGLGASGKIPAVVALGFLAAHVAHERGGGFARLVRYGAACSALGLGMVAAVSVGSGLGFGWIQALAVPNLLRSWLSVTTDLGVLGGWLGGILGLGDHTDAVLDLTRAAGLGVAALVCVLLVFMVLNGRLHAVAGMGYGFGAVFLAGPVLHPWYLLWAVVPLAASVRNPRIRGFAVAVCAIVALLVPPTGADFSFRTYQLPMAITAAALLALVPLAVVRGRVPKTPAT
ncbi:polyprenol phosphomannose-dependent alpha 1,6 mannosyltransferase MptB [Actinomycetospora lutea]|uniref:polyprenol phosphomannose-dependent alpha 1,6 mannosyltransferase MptB n=1 Tax=Actinomycetospora lutea TaxID=663604 RepID=UPI0023656879|nr:polyprenol phosphomannose-dependent alpha 1,6 mannosyltransferase MptB [Actinomycetospora lutea]MDD7937524.1 polyprenol phosphomannose-dependent alpha 1,6 mannosyltransferase MptB [Actinomycetospora lutea]